MDNTTQTNGLQLRKVQRQKARLRIGLSGVSGSGKTYSALLLASGITTLDKVCIIDTENGSADLYDSIGEYNVITLVAPFSPERYIEAIKNAESSGMEVIILDSVTHEWDGKGGCLEINELLGATKFRGNSWAAWSVTTPRHRKFIDAILQSDCHVITTARTKIETVIGDDKKVKKVGTKEIQREGFEYELTLNMNVDRDTHMVSISKDRTGLFNDIDPFRVTKKTGETLKNWANKGVTPVKKVVVIEAEEQADQPVSEEEPVKPAAKKVHSETTNESKVCSAHDEPIEMFRGVSKTKIDEEGNPKTYWWHKGQGGEMCFGSGYMEKRA